MPKKTEVLVGRSITLPYNRVLSTMSHFFLYRNYEKMNKIFVEFPTNIVTNKVIKKPHI